MGRSASIIGRRSTCRYSTINFCRKNIFSAINSRLLRFRSASVLIIWFVLVGKVHCLNRLVGEIYRNNDVLLGEPAHDVPSWDRLSL